MNGRKARGEERSGLPWAGPVEPVDNLLLVVHQIHRPWSFRVSPV
ncbi:hypothetical protein Btus_2693 [Kyrpidia tusciae DSM 2912]|uniref:Uncharacterized protein n=1 Tax=Kyrpidia tusciae (strain DSM 2912 / NBRC 15312 / T2) TaxID=562970 RepID=D5WU91_KYRT2|nr:hypothetical protein Btus_2693 [Kyrpidia tusciae DSM 2912]